MPALQPPTAYFDRAYSPENDNGSPTIRTPISWNIFKMLSPQLPTAYVGQIHAVENDPLNSHLCHPDCVSEAGITSLCSQSKLDHHSGDRSFQASNSYLD